MLKKNVIKSASQAQSYYKKEYAREDYYGKDSGEQVIGIWGGKTAKPLGLKDGISSQDFHALCNNLKPNGKKLTARNDKNRRVGYDFTFNAPKSVSLLYCLTGNDKILEAFNDAVRLAMSELEKDAGVRIRGKLGTNNTANIVYGQFNHMTTRPLEDGFPDPHLHAHCFIINASYEKDSESFKALDYASISKHTNYYEAVFHSYLAKRLKDMGLEIRNKGRFWELANIKDAVLAKFSRRTSLIEKIAKDNNIQDIKQKQELGKKTRQIKKNELSKKLIMKNWFSRFSSDDIKHLEQDLRGKHQTVDTLKRKMTLQQVIDISLEHITERQSVFSKKYLIEHALRQSYGDFNLMNVTQGLKSLDSQLIQSSKNEDVLTTQHIMQEEKYIINHVKATNNCYSCFGRKDYQFKDKLFNDEKFNTIEQEFAIRRVLNSRNGVCYIKGKAGTGKTTILKEIKSGIEENAGEIIAFAPTTSAVAVMKEEGFTKADTVARLLLANKTMDLNNKVFLIDEAGLIGSKDMAQVMKIASDNNARIILVGDTGQHSSVARGDALRCIENYSMISPVQLNKTNRQKVAEYKAVVSDITGGRIKEAFDKMQDMGVINQIKSIDNRLDKLADLYIGFLTRGEKNLIISPTHKEGDMITAKLRQNLKNKQLIANIDTSIDVLVSKNYTKAEQTNFNNYQIGDIIEYNKKGERFKRGDRLEVSDIENNQVVVKDKNLVRTHLFLNEADKFTVYRQKTLAFAEGDQVKITKNITDKQGYQLPNGSTYKVTEITDGEISFTNSRGRVHTIDKDIKHFKHGYVSTSIASQGKTCDNVIISQSGTILASIMHQKQFYVDVTRGKKSCHIFTDDLDKLKDNLIKSTGSRNLAQELDFTPAREIEAGLQKQQEYVR
jgi:conjugative relaxase-like TrwC/TraI family protein